MTKDVVFEVIAREQGCSQESIAMESRLDELGIDSLRAITILYELEERFNVEIPNELIESLQTVGDIVINIKRLRTATNA
jgi:acyl carrier protein